MCLIPHASYSRVKNRRGGGGGGRGGAVIFAQKLLRKHLLSPSPLRTVELLDFASPLLSEIYALFLLYIAI